MFTLLLRSKSFAPAVLLLTSLTLGILHGDGKPDVIKSEYPETLRSGKYHLVAKLKGGRLMEVTFKLIPYRVRFPHDPSAPVYWREEGATPKTLIGQMAVKIDGHDAGLSLSEYDYLGDPWSFTAFQEKDTYVVQMEAGDAAGSYTEKWIFRYSKNRSEYLLVKRLRTDEMQDVQESTDYNYYDGPPWPQNK